MSLFKITLFFETQVKNRIFTSAAPVDVFFKKKCLLLTEDPTTKLQHVNRHNLSCGRETPNYQNKFFTRNFIIRNFRVFELRLEIKKVLVTILIKTNNLQLKFTIFSTLYHILKVTARFNLLRQRYIRYCFFLQYIFFMEGFPVM